LRRTVCTAFGDVSRGFKKTPSAVAITLSQEVAGNWPHPELKAAWDKIPSCRDFSKPGPSNYVTQNLDAIQEEVIED
jgi:hypothetical protein